MRKKVKTILLSIPVIIFSFSACKKDMSIETSTGIVTPDVQVTMGTPSSSITEDFETGTKTSYAAGNVTLTTGSWNMNDALIGTSSSDAKTGSQSARIRNTGTVTMNFDATNGAGTVTVQHAVYGSDGTSTWGLFKSTNGGSSYTQVGSAITSSSTTLSTASFTVNVSGNVRFQIQKLSGGTNRINIDNITINPYTQIYVPDNDHLLLGNPSNAKTTLDSSNNYLMIKTYYDISYNSTRGTPNWVSWHLYTGDFGGTDRLNNFRADSSLPASFYWVKGTDYSGSGFDRGHNCPSADRTSSVSANSATFLMSNMIPQAPNNNQITWGRMEDSIRAYVNQGNEAFIQMGAYGIGGTGSNGTATTIAGGHVTVPAYIWKLVVLIPNGNNDLNRIDTSARVIAVIIPNINTVNSSWKTYRTSANAIQTATGYSLMTNISSSIRNVLLAKVDNK
ncbi:MAG: DNA/RNA non-specific endonuclease [Bacteroidetes bacterium]|nr:DNA/RNA non-specific endonuclease [Bacteroidota bacterium]MBS1592293.1 DNA/RNA non-specific endonuclease [Bacteroidota bacterium]